MVCTLNSLLLFCSSYCKWNRSYPKRPIAQFLLYFLSLLFICTSPPGTSFIDFASVFFIHVPAHASTESVTFTPPYKKFCCIDLKYKQSPFVKYIILVSKYCLGPAFDYLDRHLEAQNMSFFLLCPECMVSA